VERGVEAISKTLDGNKAVEIIVHQPKYDAAVKMLGFSLLFLKKSAANWFATGNVRLLLAALESSQKL
jgi:hypothetical protein